MPSLFRATIGLQRSQWEYHKQNPGRLSQICQNAVDKELAFESLPDDLRDAAYDEAGKEFFNRYDLQGDYAIENNFLVQHEATYEQMQADAALFDIDRSKLIDVLNDLLDIEIVATISRKIIRRR
jgi:hypothetical protein